MWIWCDISRSQRESRVVHCIAYPLPNFWISWTWSDSGSEVTAHQLPRGFLSGSRIRRGWSPASGTSHQADDQTTPFDQSFTKLLTGGGRERCIFTVVPLYLKNTGIICSYTVSARIIERSQEYKSTVEYRTFVLLRIPIPRGFGPVL